MGDLFFTINMTRAEIRNDITIPSRGAITIKITILITPPIITELTPELAIAAPTRPPTRVWEELEGKPHHHVNRFQAIAAIRAADITVRLITSGSITPFPIVAATFNGNTRKATKLKVAASKTAEKGDKTLVETTVAIEFAESWNPLMKSKIRTKVITMYKKVI